MTQVTDEMVDAYVKAYENTAPDAPRACLRAGLQAVLDILDAQTIATVQSARDEDLRLWAIDRAIASFGGKHNVSSTAVVASAENFVSYVKGTQS